MATTNASPLPDSGPPADERAHNSAAYARDKRRREYLEIIADLDGGSVPAPPATAPPVPEDAKPNDSVNDALRSLAESGTRVQTGSLSASGMPTAWQDAESREAYKAWSEDRAARLL